MRSKCGQVGLLGVAAIIGLAVYLWPLTNYQENLAGVGGDLYSQTQQAEWLCGSFWTYDLWSRDFFYPYGVNFARGYDTILPILAVCPLRALGGVAVMNGLVILQLGLILVSSMLVAGRYLKYGWSRAAFVLLYGFGAFTLARLGGHINILGTVWGMALAFYMFDRLELERRKQAIKAFVVLGAILVSTWQNMPNLFVLVAWLTGRAMWLSGERKKAVVNVGLGLVVMLGLMAPLAAPIVGANWGGRLPTAESGTVWYLSWQHYLMPNKNQIWYEMLPDAWKKSVVEVEHVAGLDPVMWLGLVGGFILWRKKRLGKVRWDLVGLMVVYGLLAYGQSFWIAGRSVSIGYWDELYRVLPFSLTRVPARLVIGFIFLGTLMSMRIWERVWERRGGWGWILAGYALLTTTVWAGNMRVPTIAYREVLPVKAYEQMRQDKREVAVLNIPLYRDQSQDMIPMLADKPLLSGYVSYAVLVEDSPEAWLESSPLLKQFECEQQFVWEEPVWGRFMPENRIDEVLVSELVGRRAGWVSVNRGRLAGRGECDWLEAYVTGGMKQVKGLEVVEEKGDYLVFKLGDDEVGPGMYVTHREGGFVEVSDRVLMQGMQQPIYIVTNRGGEYGYRLELASLVGEVKGWVALAGEVQELEGSRVTATGQVWLEPGSQRLDVWVERCGDVPQVEGCFGYEVVGMEVEG